MYSLSAFDVSRGVTNGLQTSDRQDMEECVRLGAACLVVATAAYACSCLPAPVCRSMWSADAVFTAKAVAKVDASVFTLQVGEVFRGATPATVEVSTSSRDAMCGYPFQIGHDYLVYAQRNSGRLVTGLCSGTKRTADAGQDLPYLRRAGRWPAALSPRPSYVFGRVSLLDRWPVRGAAVVARKEGGAEERAATGENGDFDFYDLPSGRYEIVVEEAGRKKVEVAAGSCVEVPVNSRAAAELWGRLFRTDGGPDPGSELRLEPATPTGEYLTSTPNKDGTFQFQAPPARYYLAAKPAGESAVIYYPGVQSKQDATPLDLRAGTGVSGVWFHLPSRAVQVVTGRVVDEAGRPIRNATVFWGGESRNGTGLSGDDGEFRFETAPGRLEIWAEATACPGVRSMKLRVAGGETTSVQIRLACGSETGADQQGRPVVGQRGLVHPLRK